MNDSTQSIQEIMVRKIEVKISDSSPKGFINYVQRKLISEAKLGKHRFIRRSALLEAQNIFKKQAIAETYK